MNEPVNENKDSVAEKEFANQVFKTGDLVRLKSGSPCMVVSHYAKEDGRVETFFYDESKDGGPGQFYGIRVYQAMLDLCDAHGEPVDAIA